MWDFPLFPDRASTIAGEVDLLFFALIGLSLVFVVAVVACILFFAVKYRRGSHADRSNPVNESILIETTWMVIPAVLGVGMFGWAATSYFDMQRKPDEEAMEIYATGKQWMWKFQHPGGAREINTLHVPAGRPVEVTLTSQDVIHSFYVPAFRIKQDALPGRYTKTWFEATKPGTYHLLCAEYCGTEHSQMGGKVHVMEPAAYAQWLETGATGGSNTEPGTGRHERTPTGGLDDPAEEPMNPDAWRRNEQEAPAPPPQAMAEAGRQLFEELRCNSCHRVDSTALYPATGPVLEGLYGHPAELQNNRSVIADAQYIRASILYPQQKLVAGYPPVMPTYKGQINEGELMRLVAYIKSLGGEGSGGGNARGSPEGLPPNSQSY
jgi:cytochrome c oxidase subunit 2